MRLHAADPVRVGDFRQRVLPAVDPAEVDAAQGSGGAVPMDQEGEEAGDVDMDTELEPGEQPLLKKTKISGEVDSRAQQASPLLSGAMLLGLH